VAHSLSKLDTQDGTAYCSDCGRRVKVVFVRRARGSSSMQCPGQSFARIGGPAPIDDAPIPPGSEGDVQKAITDALTLAGCDWWSTSAHRQKGPSGVTKGIPDLFVRLPSMARGIAVGIEVKAAKGKPSAHQAQAMQKGLIAAVVRSPLEALQAVDAHCGTVSEEERLRLRRIIESMGGRTGLSHHQHARVEGT